MFVVCLFIVARCSPFVVWWLLVVVLRGVFGVSCLLDIVCGSLFVVCLFFSFVVCCVLCVLFVV